MIKTLLHIPILATKISMTTSSVPSDQYHD